MITYCDECEEREAVTCYDYSVGDRPLGTCCLCRECAERIDKTSAIRLVPMGRVNFYAEQLAATA